MSLFDKLLKNVEKTNRPVKADKPLLFTVDLAGVGAVYPCWKNQRMQRKAQLARMHEGDPVYFEQSAYERKPMFLVENAKGIDLCVLSEGATEYLIKMVDGLVLKGSVIDPDVPKFKIEVYGEYKKKLEPADPPETKHEYTYYIGDEDVLFTLPVGVELDCKVVEFEEALVVKRGKAVLGVIPEKRKEKLKSMLSKYECTTTVRCDLKTYGTSLAMILRF